MIIKHTIKIILCFLAFALSISVAIYVAALCPHIKSVQATSTDYAVAANGYARQGSPTFTDTENGLQVTFAASNNRFEIYLGDQSDAYDNSLWLQFTIDTTLTSIKVGGCNGSSRYNETAITFASSGASYKVTSLDGNKTLVQIPISVLYNASNISNLSIRFYDANAAGTFTLSGMYIIEYEDFEVRGNLLFDNKNFKVEVDSAAYSTITFEYKILNGGTFGLALLNDYSNYFGYFTFNSVGAASTYAGITTQTLSDGYVRVTINIAALTAYVGTRPTTLKAFYINSGRTSAQGYIDNVSFT